MFGARDLEGVVEVPDAMGVLGGEDVGGGWVADEIWVEYAQDGGEDGDEDWTEL